MSLLSDTTNPAITIVGVDLFEHIKHISLTTIPAFIISFIIYVLLLSKQSLEVTNIVDYQIALESSNLMFWTSWIPLVILIICTIFRIPAFVALAASSLVATLLAWIQTNLAWTDIWAIWFNGYTGMTSFAAVDDLLTKGGIQSMLFTIFLVILALSFGGLLFVTGVIPSILATFQEKIKRVRTTIISAALTAIGINVFIGEQYLSILITGETFKGLYEKVGLSKKALARTLEDAGTVINPLVPWSICGVFIANIHAVPVHPSLFLFLLLHYVLKFYFMKVC